MDNMMLSPRGGLFCVNCKSAFGNFRRKFGHLKRETHFAGLFGNPDGMLMRALGGIGSESFTQMADRAALAFVACRRHAHLLLATLSLLRLPWPPDALGVDSDTLSPHMHDDGLADAQFVKAHLHLEMTDAAAYAHFRAELTATALAGAKRINSMVVHNLRHFK